MADDESFPNTEINPQVVNAVKATNFFVVAQARSQSQALAYEGLASAVNLMMLNSAHNQFGAQKVQIAMVAATSAKILESAG